MSQFHTLNIISVQQVTTQSVAISFEIPENLKSVYRFNAGQYVTLKTTINGEEVRRDYSICASRNSGDLTVAVKAVEGGTFSVYANSNLKAGDSIEVSAPNGRFVFEPNKDRTRTISAFAAGRTDFDEWICRRRRMRDFTESQVPGKTLNHIHARAEHGRFDSAI